MRYTSGEVEERTPEFFINNDGDEVDSGRIDGNIEPDYVYNFLKGFYIDPDSPTGVDNRVLAGTSMPHVLWELQGYQNAVFSTDENGTPHFENFEQVTAGSMTTEEFDAFARDTANFMAYMSEPIRSTRRVLGVWVLMFLVFFWIIASMLKKQVWKDVS